MYIDQHEPASNYRNLFVRSLRHAAPRCPQSKNEQIHYAQQRKPSSSPSTTVQTLELTNQNSTNSQALYLRQSDDSKTLYISAETPLYPYPSEARHYPLIAWSSPADFFQHPPHPQARREQHLKCPDRQKDKTTNIPPSHSPFTSHHTSNPSKSHHHAFNQQKLKGTHTHTK